MFENAPLKEKPLESYGLQYLHQRMFMDLILTNVELRFEDVFEQYTYNLHESTSICTHLHHDKEHITTFPSFLQQCSLAILTPYK